MIELEILDMLLSYESHKEHEAIKNSNAQNLVMAEMLCKLGLYAEARKHLMQYIDEYIYEESEIQTAIILSVKLNCFKEFFKQFIQWESCFTDVWDHCTEFKIVYKFYKWMKQGNKFSFSEERIMSFTAEQRMLYYYLCGIVAENSVIKKANIRRSLSYAEDNNAACLLLAKAGINEDLKALSNLYHMNCDYFMETKIIPSKREGIGKISFIPLGGGNCIGASCYLLNINDKCILIDCGSGAGGEQSLPNLRLLQEVCTHLDLIIVTHSHFDHMGALGELVKIYPNTPIFLTKETEKLMEPELAAYQQCQSSFTYIMLEKRYEMLGMNFTFYRAGHLPGAVAAFIESNAGNVFMTGDFSVEDQYFVKGIEVPCDKEIDYLIMETTYANKIRESHRSYEFLRFLNHISTLIKEKKNVLTAGFSKGRIQEILKSFSSASIENNFRIYVDGSAKRYIDIYIELGYEVISPKLPIFEVANEERDNFMKNEFYSEPACLIASGGMLQKGSSAERYALDMLRRENCECILTGYQAKGTLGSKLSDLIDIDNKGTSGRTYIQYEGSTIEVKCGVSKFNFSAHADAADMLALIAYIKPRKVVLVHGDSCDESLLTSYLDKKDIDYYPSHNEEWINLM